VWSAAAIGKEKERSCSSRRHKQQQASSNDDDTRDLGYAATTKAKGRIRARVSLTPASFVVFFRPQTKLVLWVLSEGSQAKSDVAYFYTPIPTWPVSTGYAAVSRVELVNGWPGQNGGFIFFGEFLFPNSASFPFFRHLLSVLLRSHGPKVK
jgi:hypothetical protein